MRNAIVIAIDRLGAGYLGPYGNTWIETPAWNRLASRATLFENMLSDSNDLGAIYRSYWSGVHAVCDRDRPEYSLAAALEQSGSRATLLTDDESLLSHPLAADFGEHIAVRHAARERAADRIEDTQFAAVTLAAIEWLAQPHEPGLLWIHAAAANHMWDAPRELAEPFRDQEDPEPYAGLTPPAFELEVDHDPDDVLRIMHAYAAQVVAMDACIGPLVDTIDTCVDEDTLLIITSPRGYPIGEHGHVGPSDNDLFGETLHVPLLLMHSGAAAGCRRTNALVQPNDLHATPAAWFGLNELQTSSAGCDLAASPADDEVRKRQVVVAQSANKSAASRFAVRTPAWMLNGASSRKPALYVKPDDRWEANEVADRCGDVSRRLADGFGNFVKQANAGGPVKVGPLDDDLVDGID